MLLLVCLAVYLQVVHIQLKLRFLHRLEKQAAAFASEVVASSAGPEVGADFSAGTFLKELTPAEVIQTRLERFFQADREVLDARETPVSFMELLLGDPQNGFRLDHVALEASYTPQSAAPPQLGALGAFQTPGFSAEQLVAAGMGTQAM